MRTMKRTFTVLFLSCSAIAGTYLLVSGTVSGQPRIVAQPAFPVQIDTDPAQPPNPGGSSSAQFSAIKLEEKSEFRQVINVARDCIRDAAWNDAVTALQTLLDQKKDYYVQVREKDKSGRETLRWTSVKFEANNLLSGLPVEALDVYELRMGGRAKALLDQAKKAGDRETLNEVALKYLHTRAGMEANDLLATYYLDRGQFFLAALRFEKLLDMNPKWAKVDDLTLFKAYLSFHRSGDAKAADRALLQLEERVAGKGGIKIGEEVVTVAKLRKYVEAIPFTDLSSPSDWPMIRGNQTNSAQAPGSPPLLDQHLWRRATIQDRGLDGAEETGQQAKAQLDNFIEKQKSLGNAPVMSGFFPIAVGNRVVYRSYLDVRCVALEDETDKNGNIVFKAGDIVWKAAEFDGSLATILAENKIRPTIEQWLAQYNNLPGFGAFTFENTMLGTISSDHRLVYAIDDLAVPAPSNIFPSVYNQTNIGKDLRHLVMQNILCAFDLDSGKFVWRLGQHPTSLFQPDPDGVFTDSHFLGVPISVGGKLFVLNEKNQGPAGDAELRLICIDPNKLTAAGGPTVIDVQPLGWVQQNHRITHDISRRTNAVHLAYGDGILVCPTNAGEVLGVDLMSRSLAWSYPYREEAPSKVNFPFQPRPGQPFIRPNPNAGSFHLANWKSAPPVIQNGKLVFTAPDASSVHCINLHDGTPVWKKRQLDGDLFMGGVFADKVLIIGRNYIRGLRLSDGEQVWYVSTGDLPSGQGLASKNVYYLPLAKGEILAVDIERGIIKAHNRAKSAEFAPGNLVFHEGAVLSQTPVSISAYPQLIARLELAEKALKADPGNPIKMIKRGELLLANGQVQLAVNDLSSALELTLPEVVKTHARGKLYEALSDLMYLDFPNASKKYLTRYRELCNVPGDNQEEQNRLARYFRVVGEGRESQGNLVEAFQMYRQFGALPSIRANGIASLDDPLHKVPTNVWLRGRVSTMMSNATPQQKLPLEAKISEEWQAVKSRKDLDAIRSFVDMFDVPFKVGREARLELASAIMDRNDREAFLEAELNLHLLHSLKVEEDSNVPGRALAGLARLEEKKGSAESMKQAAAYYRELQRNYASVAVRGKKTGDDLVNELATDPRFLPYLEEAKPIWSDEKIAVRDLPGINIPHLQGFIFQPEGELTATMRQQRLVLDPNNSSNPQLRLYDLTNNKVLWTQPLGSHNSNAIIFRYLYQQGQSNTSFLPNARFRFYKVLGDLAVLQVGAVAYCINLDNGRILWRHDLIEDLPNQPHMRIQQVQPDAEGNLQIIVWNQFNGQRTRMSIGQIGSVQASHVALVTQKGLVVLDPLRGTLLWRKMDVPGNSRVFGDNQHVFVVEMDDNDTIGTARTLRAIDGTPVKTDDFTKAYRERIRILGRRILASSNDATGGLLLRLYDPLLGKDVWAKKFAAHSQIFETDDNSLTGVIEPNGQATGLDAVTGKVLFTNTVLHRRVQQTDLKDLKNPLLLRDADHFYVALNHDIDGNKVSGRVIANNFSNGLRCMEVNGWVLAFHREDGKHVQGDKTLPHKRGDFHWHSVLPVENQMLVLEQFDTLPILLFSARYNELIGGGNRGNRWVSVTKSLHRATGQVIYDPGTTPSNSSAQFYAFNIDLKNASINMIGFNGSVQHYLEGRKPVAPTDDGTGSATEKTSSTTTPYKTEVRRIALPGMIPGNFPQPLPGIALPPGVALPPLNVAPVMRIPMIRAPVRALEVPLPVAPPPLPANK